MIFFNAGDPYFGEVKISARGNLSIEEINKLTSDVEDIISNHPGIKNYFLQTGQFSSVGQGGGSSTEDQIASAFFEFKGIITSSCGPEMLLLAFINIIGSFGISMPASSA